ncbi:MAG: hypothetical protein JWP25_7987 [Bradyrhizobium sp.]|nr:hypothetical protein [Bradyrhizobium sp.]
MKRGPKLTPAQRQALLACYLEHGFHAARPLAESFGVRAKYLAQLARHNGHTNNHQRKNRAVRKATHKDPRWQWAIARGPVLI